MTSLACAGAGITFGMQESFRAWIEQGNLVPVFEDYSPSFAGFYLYYPSRRNMAAKLRAFVDHVKRFDAISASLASPGDKLQHWKGILGGPMNNSGQSELTSISAR